MIDFGEPHRIGPNYTGFVKHDPWTGRAYVDITLLEPAASQLGYDVDEWARQYETGLRERGAWPSDLPPLI